MTSLQDFIADGLLIDGDSEGSSDLGVVEGWAQDVGAEKTDPDVGLLSELIRIFFLRERDKFGRDGVGDMELIVSKHPGFSVVVADGKIADAIERNGRGVPVVRIAFEFDEVVGGPLLELKGPVGDHVSDMGPRRGKGRIDFTVFENDVFGDGIPCVVFGDLGKKGYGSAKFQVKGEIVDGFHADF